MATNGWIGEQTVHSWGSYNSRLTTNVYINGIRRYSDHIDVSGVIYLFCKSSGARTVWYDWAITAWCGGRSLGQIKPRTYNNNILGKSWSKNFSIRINCSNSATSATFQVGFSDSNMGGKDKYWTLYFDRYATSPSGITSVAAYTQYSTISTSCSGISWGQGYSSRSLTCTASYTYNGKTENFTLGTWTDGATSKSVTKTDFNFPADLNVTVKWTASTNIGSTSSTTQVRAKQTFPAPNLNNITFTAESTAPYCIRVNVSGVDFGDNYSARKLELYGTYELDGIIYDNKLGEISNQTSWTLEYDASQEAEPWTKIPDDSSILLRLVADNGNRTSDKTIIINCQSSYEAYVIEHIPEEEKEKSETYTGKNIQIQNAPKDAPLADFKLDGETSQNGTPTPDAPVPVQTVTGENVVKITGKNLFDKDSANVLNAYFALPNDTAITSNALNRTLYIPCDANTTYTFQAMGSNWTRQVGYTQETPAAGVSVAGITNLAANATHVSITTGSSARYIVFRFWHQNNSAETYQQALDSIQIELGNQATTYETYQGQSYEVNLNAPNLYDKTQAVKTGGSNQNVSFTTTVDTSTHYIFDCGTRTWVTAYLYDSSDAQTRTIGGVLESHRVEFTTTSAEVKVQLVFYVGADVPLSSVDFSMVNFYKPSETIELCKIGTYQDYIYKSGGKWYVEKNTAKIASYAGETISTDYISTTGQLTTGATVYYALATPTDTEITNEALIAQLETLLNIARTYAGVNNIFTIALNEQGTLEIQYYTKWQNTSPAILSANGRNGTGNFKQIRRIGTK